MKRRSESFWGIHGDFHARPWMGPVGRTLKEEDIRKICRELAPDFLQIDCKGHFGWASYPTALGNAMPTIGNPLALWRKVTREENVALYMHYSGLWDEKYCSEHPEEAVLNADGTYHKTVAFPLGRYVDDVLIPQISELVEKYEIDGVWIDGDCWASVADYREETLAAFEKETGICLHGQKPASPLDPYYHEYINYNRDLFRRYAKHYVDMLHKKYPDLQIASNWMFSDMMPEEVSVDIDFISGDTTPFDSVNTMRYAARYLTQQNRPWDIMGMAIRYNGEHKMDLLTVHVTQVMQQAAAAISLGGAFQFCLSQYFDGSPRLLTLLHFRPIAEFLREREPFCFRGTVMPQVAMLASTYDRYLDDSALFSRGTDDFIGKRGMASLLGNAGQSFEVISEHTLRKRAKDFPLIVLPEILHGLESDTVTLLLDYVREGGSLMLVGTNTCRIFEEAGAPFSITVLDDEVPTGHFLAQKNEAKDQRYFTIDGKSLGGVMYPMQVIGTKPCEIVAHTCYREDSEQKPLAIICPFGKGKIAAIAANIGFFYDKSVQYLQRDLIKIIAEKLYTPFAKIESSVGAVDLVCLQKDGRILLQLMNCNGNHQNILCDTEDFIPPALDIELSIALPQAPKALMLQPQNISLAFSVKNGRVHTKIDRLDLHSVVEIIEVEL